MNFPKSLKNAVNYENPNLNVSIPIFTIHGNHDDVINSTSALDVLSSTGLINYFGQWKDLEKIQVSPIVLQKNESIIALYGLNHIPDRRLNHLITSKSIKIGVPESIEEAFCMFVLHQNRADRGARNYIVENTLPAFLDLIIWGHEHDCRIEPEAFRNTHIVQPGSSVATSLSQGESIEKKVGILEIKGKKFKLTPVVLRTVRPFIFRSIDIKDYNDELKEMRGEARDRVEKLLNGIVKEMMEEAKKRISGHSRQPKLPLLRLRVSYDDNQLLINPKRFGQSYVNLIANPDDLLLFKKSIKRTMGVNKNDPDNEILDAAIRQREKQDRVEDVVESYFKQLTDEKDKLKLLNLESLSEVCRILVERDDEQGATDLIEAQVTASRKFLNNNNVAEDQLKDALKQFNEQESKQAFDEELRIVLARQNDGIPGNDDNNSGGNDEEEDGPPAKKTTRGRGRGKGATGSTRGKKASPTNDSPNTSTSSRGSRGGRGRQAAAPKASIAQQLSSNRSLRANNSRPNPYITDSSDDD